MKWRWRRAGRRSSGLKQGREPGSSRRVPHHNRPSGRGNLRLIRIGALARSVRAFYTGAVMDIAHSPAPTRRLLLPVTPALVAGARKAVWLTSDGEVETIDLGEARLRLQRDTLL